MSLRIPAILLRVFLGELDELDELDGRRLCAAIVQKARAEGLAGATVLRVVESFGVASLLQTARILCLAEDLPVVSGIVEAQEMGRPFVDTLGFLVAPTVAARPPWETSGSSPIPLGRGSVE